MEFKNVVEFLIEADLECNSKLSYIDGSDAITYGKLLDSSFYIGNMLLEYSQCPIAILMDKSAKEIIAFLGVACSRNYYIPLDTEAPFDRKQGIINILQCPVIITDEHNIDTAKKLAYSVNADVIVINSNLLSGGTFNKQRIINRLKSINPDDTLYILFTSGSTGTPKGVEISHKAVIAYAEWTKTVFNLDDTIILGNQTPFYFSMSVFDIYTTLRNHGTMYIIPKKLFSFPIKLLEYIRDNNINLLYWVPTALCMVTNLRALGKIDISCVKRILFAGEVMPTKHFNMWLKELPNTTFVNMFGPTEVTDICNYYVIQRLIANDEPIPIGDVCPGLFMKLINNGEESKTEGELYIGGSTLAKGYYKDEEKTRKSFVKMPIDMNNEETFYKTGDFVRYNNNHELVYVSRIDNQIKHKGHRVELGDIEATVSSLPEIQLAAAVYDQEHLKIVLFFTGSANSEFVKNFIKNKLPDYMIPSVVRNIQAMPLNANGKIDRKQLIALFSSSSIDEGSRSGGVRPKLLHLQIRNKPLGNNFTSLKFSSEAA